MHTHIHISPLPHPPHTHTFSCGTAAVCRDDFAEREMAAACGAGRYIGHWIGLYPLAVAYSPSEYKVESYPQSACL
jgi:hypothetical protein